MSAAFSIKSDEARSSFVAHNSTAFTESFIDTLIKSPSFFSMLFYGNFIQMYKDVFKFGHQDFGMLFLKSVNV